MVKEITSLQNPLIKHLIQIKEKSRARKKAGIFLIEGRREIMLAVKGGYHLETVFFNPEIILDEDISKLTPQNAEIIEISKEVYQRLAHRDKTEGILAVAKSKSHKLSDLKLTSKNLLILVAEAPEKPGNIGALLRTADAAKIDAVIIANPKSDLYNPNSIRSSVGCVFTNQVAVGSTQEIIHFLKANNVDIYCAALQSSELYTSQDYTKSSAIVMGTESTGLSGEWLEQSKKNIIIPMLGEIDSMNVSVAAGILIFEAKRQRDFK